VAENARTVSDHRSFLFGKEVFGPIFAEFALRLFIFLSSIEKAEDSAVLFCSRGGLRLKLLYERLLERLSLEPPVHTDHIMISRLIAARPALLRHSPAAYDEITWEFRKESLQAVVSAITQLPIALSEEWQGPHSMDKLRRFFASDHPDAQRAREALQTQVDLFRQHLVVRSLGRKQIVLCDTGLNGTTLKLIQQGIPEIDWSCALFARRNYKRGSIEHFDRLVGISIEQEHYSPFNARTAVLRYWHLIEWILEPDLPSAKTFQVVAGRTEPQANLEIDRWEDRLNPPDSSLFSGAMSYIDELGSAPVDSLGPAADKAWRRLRRAIIWPSASDLEIIGIGSRSADFGRDDETEAFTAYKKSTLRGKLESIRACYWREGEITLGFPAPRLMLTAVEGYYTARWAYRSLKEAL